MGNSPRPGRVRPGKADPPGAAGGPRSVAVLAVRAVDMPVIVVLVVVPMAVRVAVVVMGMVVVGGHRRQSSPGSVPLCRVPIG